MRLVTVSPRVHGGHHDICTVLVEAGHTTGANPTLPFSPAVKAGGLIYVAGMLGTDASGAIAGDVKAQTKQTLDNIGATLKAGGSSMARRRACTSTCATPATSRR